MPSERGTFGNSEKSGNRRLSKTVGSERNEGFICLALCFHPVLKEKEQEKVSPFLQHQLVLLLPLLFEIGGKLVPN